MIFAVSTDHDVILYDTQQKAPFARFQDIHYTRLTDLTWSNDGKLLIASSTDGFCALITFDVNELGFPYVKEESEGEENPMDVSGCEELEKEENEEIGKETTVKEKKRPSFLEQWAIKTPKKIKLDQKDDKSDQWTVKTPKTSKLHQRDEKGVAEWAVKTTKKMKLDRGDDNVAKSDKRWEIEASEGEVIEIKDDEDEKEELSQEIREEIHKLIPSRTNSAAGSSKVDDKSVAKPIAVRRKPRTEEVTKEGE